MSIKKDLQKEFNKLEKEYKQSKDPKQYPYDFYLHKKSCIIKYYERDKQRLLDNEQALVERRNYIYNNYVKDSLSKKVISVSILLGMISSFLYSIIETFSSALTTLIISNIIINGISIIIVLIFYFKLVDHVYKMFANKNYNNELYKYEFNIIEKLLNKKYCNKKANIIEKNIHKVIRIKVKVKT